MSAEKILSIHDLTVHFFTVDMGVCQAVNHFSLDMYPGETVGLVGETGAGKTTVALSILGLLQSPPGKVLSGTIAYKGTDLLKLKQRELQKIRGKEIAMVFQDPMTALNPTDCIGDQIAEGIHLHQNCSHEEAVKRAIEMLEMVGISKDRYQECSPQILLADEPTTALDVTIQAQVLELMNDLKQKLNTAVLLITHDLGVVAETCQKVAIMYAGEIVEYGTCEQIFDNILHPYTKGLFSALPNYAKDSRRLQPITGLMPDPADLPPLCKFAPRCPNRCKRCENEMPELIEAESGHFVRCLLAGERRES